MRSFYHRFYVKTGFLLGLVALLVSNLAGPALAHWADNATLDLKVEGREATAELVLPTDLLASADDNHDGKLGTDEVMRHQATLLADLGRHVVLRAGESEASPASPARLMQVVAVAQPADAAPDRSPHSALRLHYTWPAAAAGTPLDHGTVAVGPVTNVTLTYTLFAPDAPAAQLLVQHTLNGQYGNG